MNVDEQGRVLFNSLMKFDPDWDIDPDDYSLAVGKDVVDLDYRLVTVYCRMYQMDMLYEIGNQCILLSQILRRILKLHGIEAHVKQYEVDIKHPTKGWNAKVGYNDHEQGGMVATHQVVVTPKWILDFAQLPFQKRFGATAPRGFIVNRQADVWQDAGPVKVRYRERENHFATKNIVFDSRENEKWWTKRYFDLFAMSQETT